MISKSDGEAWPRCAAYGCNGRRAGRYDLCIAHLDKTRLEEVLVILNVGSNTDFRGVSFTKPRSTG